MESLVQWLKMLDRAKPEDLVRMTLRLFVPGHTVMNYDGWLMTTEQFRDVPPGFRGGFPESMALLAYLDDATQWQNMIHNQRLSMDIAAAMSVALERRIDIPCEIAARVEGHDEVTFLPWSGMVDRMITGPLPQDSQTPIAEIFRQVVGLPDDDIPTIGAATSMFHGAVLLHEHDARAAYTLLVAGIETLSREYGQPPTDWNAWELSDEWDAFIIKHGLSLDQSLAFREHLMKNKQLRLKATFKSYASCQLRASFWDQPWIEWTYTLHVPPGNWGAPEKLHDGLIRDFLPTDRAALSKALGLSYDLRSRYVHKGAWFGPLELSLNPASPVDISQPLPFAVLRAILRELILMELESKTQGGTLPDVPLRRNWVLPAGENRT